MRLLVNVGYYKMLFSKECNMAAVIDAVSNSVVVEEVGPYGNRVLTVKPDAEIEIKLIQDEDIRLPHSDKPEAITTLLEITKERDELNLEVYKLKAEIKKIKDTINPPEQTKTGSL
jgi:hypothetical protein